MEEIAKLIKESEERIHRIESETEEFNKKYVKEKGEFKKIMRSDFLTGGIIASSLFIIINSLTSHFSISFPYDLLIGISGFLLGIIILIVPVIKPRVRFSKFEDRIFNIVSEFQKVICQKVKAIKIEFRRFYPRFDVDTKIPTVEDVKIIDDKLFNLYKEGVNGLTKLKNQSPEIIYIRISKIIEKYIKTFEKVHNSMLFDQLAIKLAFLRRNEGETLEKKDFKKLRYEMLKTYFGYHKLFKSKLREKSVH